MYICMYVRSLAEPNPPDGGEGGTVQHFSALKHCHTLL